MAAKKTFLIVGLAALAAGLGYFAYHRTDVPASGAVANTQSPVERVETGAVGEDVKSGQNGSAVNSQATKFLSFYQCQTTNCGNDPFAASTEEEARWLRTHGYPTDDQRKELDNLSATQLKARAANGDLAYMALYGEKLTQEGRNSDALAVLGSAVDRGSVYALYSISDVYAANSPLKNPLSSKVYLRLAYLAGDSKATTALAQRFPDFDSKVDNAIVDKEAAHLQKTFLKGRTWPRP